MANLVFIWVDGVYYIFLISLNFYNQNARTQNKYCLLNLDSFSRDKMLVSLATVVRIFTDFTIIPSVLIMSYL